MPFITGNFCRRVVKMYNPALVAFSGIFSSDHAPTPTRAEIVT